MRRVGYGVVGLIIGIIVYLLLLTNMPSAVTVKANRNDFVEKEDVSDYIPNEDYYKGGNIVPFLEYGSYHVSATDLVGYEKAGVIKYGKLDPSYFFKQEKVDEDKNDDKDDKEDKNNTDDKKDKDNTDGHKVTDGKGSDSLEKEMQKGFDIHSRTEKDEDISSIRKAFKDSAVMPIDEKYYKISSKYGRRVDPFENVNAYHVGLDIASEGINGQNIYSVLDGEVVAAGFDDAGYGNYIIIEHDGFETLYAHMKSETLLKVGDRVKSGDVIGYIGSTGRSTGPHLHFEVGIGGLKFNPEIFIKEIRKGE